MFGKKLMRIIKKQMECILHGDFKTPLRTLNNYAPYLLSLISLPHTYCQQNHAISSINKNVKTLVIYFIPQVKAVSGGIKSIFNMHAVTNNLLRSDDCEVLLITLPSIITYAKNNLFKNTSPIFRLSQITAFTNIDKLIIHIPEYAVVNFASSLNKKYKQYLSSIPNVQINIMNQNSLLCPPPKTCNILRNITSNITQTTAFARDTTQERANLYNMPVHLFGAMDNPSEYHLKIYSEKKNIIVLSPDLCPFLGEKGPAMVEMIRSILSEQLPDYQQVVVSNMKYADYLTLISDAKYAITFGEGYDSYFIQPHLSGSISFTVYNDMFFPCPEWSKFPTVFSSYEKMADEIVDLIHHYDSHPNEYAELNKKICEEYSIGRFTPEIFAENLLRYYRGEYDYVPQN